MSRNDNEEKNERGDEPEDERSARIPHVLHRDARVVAGITLHSPERRRRNVGGQLRVAVERVGRHGGGRGKGGQGGKRLMQKASHDGGKIKHYARC